jgi:hypothetical protein
MSGKYGIITSTVGGLFFAASTVVSVLQHRASTAPVAVSAKLSEWKVELSESKIGEAASPTPWRSRARGLSKRPR